MGNLTSLRAGTRTFPRAVFARIRRPRASPPKMSGKTAAAQGQVLGARPPERVHELRDDLTREALAGFQPFLSLCLDPWRLPHIRSTPRGDLNIVHEQPPLANMTRRSPTGFLPNTVWVTPSPPAFRPTLLHSVPRLAPSAPATLRSGAAVSLPVSMPASAGRYSSRTRRVADGSGLRSMSSKA